MHEGGKSGWKSGRQSMADSGEAIGGHQHVSLLKTNILHDFSKEEQIGAMHSLIGIGHRVLHYSMLFCGPQCSQFMQFHMFGHCCHAAVL